MATATDDAQQGLFEVLLSRLQIRQHFLSGLKFGFELVEAVFQVFSHLRVDSSPFLCLPLYHSTLKVIPSKETETLLPPTSRTSPFVRISILPIV